MGESPIKATLINVIDICPIQDILLNIINICPIQDTILNIIDVSPIQYTLLHIVDIHQESQNTKSCITKKVILVRAKCVGPAEQT